jgi:hypothetical protein
MAIQANFPTVKPSLLLDFANTKQLDPRITYTRASTATFYNGVTTAMAEQNLLLQSQTFNTSWNAINATITADTVVAPDGTTTADVLIPSTSNDRHGIYQGLSSFTIGSPFTYSFYAKSNGYDFIQITLGTNLSAGSSWFIANLTSGAVTELTQGTLFGTVTSSVVSVGSGWYRVVINGTAVASGTISIQAAIYASNVGTGITYTNGAPQFTGNGTSGVSIWGAQAEVRSAVTAYTATTTQAITNYIPVLQTAASGVARFDNNPTTGESLGLLIEESRTNLMTYSSQFDNAAWTKVGTTITADTMVAPDGTLTADGFISSATTAPHYLNWPTPSLTSGTAYTSSFYAKAAGYNYVAVASISVSRVANALFDLSTGTVVSTTGTATITSVGNGWYRCTATLTSPSTGSDVLAIALANTNAGGYVPSFAGNGYSGVLLWGAQFEQGAFATSYIPTVASQVTRAADDASMTSTNFSSWYNQGEGAFYAEAATSVYDIGRTIFEANDGTASNRLYLGRNSSTTQGIGTIITGGATQANIPVSNTFVGGGSGRLSMSLAVNTINVAGNGTLGTTDTTAILPVVNSIRIGAAFNGSTVWNGTIKKIAYYPIKLTSTNLQAITS